jgi:ATP-dependent DNA helicase HFM1/MER3
MFTLKQSPQFANTPLASLRTLAVSATIPNIEDVAEWLNVPAAGLLQFGEHFRPVPVEKIVLGYRPAKNDFLFEKNLDYRLLELIQKYGDGKPCLVFCGTRSSAKNSANFIAKQIGYPPNELVRSQTQRNALNECAASLADRALAELIVRGIGYHSGGVSFQDRAAIESLFERSLLQVLCTTTSLSQGVNLPAHLVIMKGTKVYTPGSGYHERNELDVVQMMGRAGRPQFDTSGVAVIMTSQESVHRWQGALSGQSSIESTMLDLLRESLNAEIVLETVCDVPLAISYLKSTYLWRRIRKNPAHYRVASLVDIDSFLRGAVVSALAELSANGLIEFEDGFSVKPTELGRCMARYYVSFDTMVQISTMQPGATLEAMIYILSCASEFKENNLRTSEKRILNPLNKLARFPTGKLVKSCEMKVSVLIQAVLGQLDIDEWGLRQEADRIVASASRVALCMVQYARMKAGFVALCNAFLLYRSLKLLMWENSAQTIRQLRGVGKKIATSLLSAGLRSFEDVVSSHPTLIEAAVGRHAPFGMQLQEQVRQLPRVRLDVRALQQLANLTEIEVRLSIEHARVSADGFVTLIVGNERDDVFLHKRVPFGSLIAGAVVQTFRVARGVTLLARAYSEAFGEFNRFRFVLNAILQLVSMLPLSLQAGALRSTMQRSVALTRARIRCFALMHVANSTKIILSSDNESNRNPKRNQKRSQTHSPKRNQTRSQMRSQTHSPKRSQTRSPKRSQTRNQKRSQTCADPRPRRWKFFGARPRCLVSIVICNCQDKASSLRLALIRAS